MFSARVEIAQFTDKLREYQKLTGKAMSEVLLEQARLLAVRLTQLTFPKSASVGKKRVAIDIGKVYLSNSWFEDKFQFNNTKYGELIKEMVRSKNAEDIRATFQNSSKLRLIRVEPFNPATHARLRRDGRIKIPRPNSFPVSDQSQVKAYTDKKKKAVGTAKAGWAACASDLGKQQPGWLSKSGTGSVQRQLSGEKKYIVLTNTVSYFASLNERANIVSRALEGRGNDMIKSAKFALKRAAKEAGLG